MYSWKCDLWQTVIVALQICPNMWKSIVYRPLLLYYEVLADWSVSYSHTPYPLIKCLLNECVNKREIESISLFSHVFTVFCFREKKNLQSREIQSFPAQHCQSCKHRINGTASLAPWTYVVLGQLLCVSTTDKNQVCSREIPPVVWKKGILFIKILKL